MRTCNETHTLTLRPQVLPSRFGRDWLAGPALVLRVRHDKVLTILNDDRALIEPRLFLSMFFELFFITLVIGAMLLHTGIKTWRTNKEQRRLVRGFAVLFTTFGVGLLVLTAAGFAGLL